MKPTAHDAAAVSEETKVIVRNLEKLRADDMARGLDWCVSVMDAAIDRLIILDNAAQSREVKHDPRVIKLTDAEARALLEDGAS